MSIFALGLDEVNWWTDSRLAAKRFGG